MHTTAYRRYIAAAALLVTAFIPRRALAGWSPLDGDIAVHLRAVRFLHAQNGYAVGDVGTVLTPSDGGSSWENVSIPTSHPARDLHMESETNGWVAIGNPDNSEVSGAVWCTTDGGTSWTQQPITSTRARLGISFASGTTGWACGARSGPIDIEATTNGGLTWTNQSSGSIFGWLYGVDAVSPTHAWSCGVAFFPTATGFIVRTTNGGAQWTQQTTGTVPFLYAIDFVDADLGFAAGARGPSSQLQTEARPGARARPERLPISQGYLSPERLTETPAEPEAPSSRLPTVARVGRSRRHRPWRH